MDPDGCSGFGYAKNEAGSTTWGALLSITPTATGFDYLVRRPGRKFVTLRLKSAESHKVVFESTWNEFPARISYTAVGERLRVEIEGVSDATLGGAKLLVTRRPTDGRP